MKRLVNRFLLAVAFLTRLPVPCDMAEGEYAIAQSAAFFPLVGAIVAGGAILVRHIFSRFVPHAVVVLAMIVFLVTVTGGFHEDALADSADGFGGGWNKDQVLTIMRDSRIGSFGALAIALSVLARYVLLSNLTEATLDGYLLGAHVVCRWTALPLAYFLPSARAESGQGGQVAGKLSTATFLVGTLFAAAILGVALGTKALWMGLAAVVVVVATGAYYRRRIGGVTGDCLGASNQLTEIALYFTGVVLETVGGR